MRYGSVCSGIEAATVAWHLLGFTPAWFAEIDPFCRALLKHHYPEVPNHGDFTQIERSEPIDILVGGTPCQDFSVAGLRAGMDGARGQLTTEFLGLADRLRPRWLVWENVPGILSIDGGRAFGAFLGRLGQCGYGFAYRVLDAQYFGVPQRRRRVFVVGHLGDWRCAAAVLFERACLSGNPAPSRETGKDIALPITSRVDRGGEHREAQGNNLIHRFVSFGEYAETDPSSTLKQRDNKDAQDLVVTHALSADGFDASEDGTGRGTPIVADTVRSHPRPGSNSVGAIAFDFKQSGEVNPTMRSLSHDKSHANNGSHLAVALPLQAVNKPRAKGGHGIGIGIDGDPGFTLGVSEQHGIATFDERNITSKTNRSRVENGAPSHSLHSDAPRIIGSGVRRLTPIECERLQGFPDGYTSFPWGSASKQIAADFLEYMRQYNPESSEDDIRRLAKDGPRYRALGNSMAVPVMAWIGRRIAAVERREADLVEQR